MQLQMRILTYFFILNIVSFVVINATTNGAYLFPGVQYAHAVNSTGNVTDYTGKMNASGAVESWSPVGSYGFAGDIFSALNMFWSIFSFLIAGVPLTIMWFGTFVPAAQGALVWVAYIIEGVMAFLFVTLVIEFISNRYMME